MPFYSDLVSSENKNEEYIADADITKMNYLE